jgi:hypothetical protein
MPKNLHIAIALRRDDVCGCVERAADPLHSARIDAKSFRYLPHALSASRCLESGMQTAI